MGLASNSSPVVDQLRCFGVESDCNVNRKAVVENSRLNH